MSDQITSLEAIRAGRAGNDPAARFADAGVWRRLTTADRLEPLCDAWLQIFCAQVDLALGTTGVAAPAVRQALVAIGDPDSNKYGRVATYGTSEVDLALAKAAERAMQLRRPVSQPGDGPALACQMAYPIMLSEKLYGVIALALVPAAAAQSDLVLRLTQWGIAWFARMLQTQRPPTHAEAEAQALQAGALRLCASGITAAAAMEATATFLADQLRLQKLSIGLRRKLNTRLLAMSHGGFGKVRNDYIAAVEAAMDEAADADATTVHPVATDAAAMPHAAHARLCRIHECDWALSVPLDLPYGRATDAVLVFTAEGTAERAAELGERIAGVAGLIGPLIIARLRDERSTAGKVLDDAERLWPARWSGGTVKLAIGTAVAAAAICALFVIPAEYRLNAKASIEGATKRALVMPFDGYIAEATARPGDRVAAGAVLARLDDRELKLQKLDLEGKIGETRRQIDEAIGIRDVAKANILTARREAYEAELAVVADNLTRTALTAPFEAYVVSGDKTQSIGAPVHRGDVGYEISPLDGFRVELQVPQSDFDEVQVGQSGRLLLSSLPYETFGVRVTRITPVASARDGETVFRVDAELLDARPEVRIGMQGVARVAVAQRSLAWIWGHAALDWLRLKLWEWLP
jgi:multidrug resistance efflux pump